MNLHDQTLSDQQLQKTLLKVGEKHDEIIRLRSKLFLWRIYAIVGWVFVMVLTAIWPR